MNRRTFLHRLGMSGVAAVAAPVLAKLAPALDEGEGQILAMQEAELLPARLAPGITMQATGGYVGKGVALVGDDGPETLMPGAHTYTLNVGKYCEKFVEQVIGDLVPGSPR